MTKQTVARFLVGAIAAAWSAGAALASPSVLDRTVELEEFGQIRYRAPLEGTAGLPIVLFHGVYGGASHRSFRELLPELDAAGKRVFVMDLPGVGESDRPKRAYRIEDLDRFVELFVERVVGARATVVAESLATLSALKVAGRRPDIVRRVVLLSPVGINSLASPPSEREQRLYDRLYNDDAAGVGFYENLLADESLRYFLRFAFFDDASVDEDLLDDYRVARTNLDQRWITLSFVGGQLYRSFGESARGVFVPVLAVFGKEYEAFADTAPTKAVDLVALRPDFDAVEIPAAGASVQREQPAAVAREILIHAAED